MDSIGKRNADQPATNWDFQAGFLEADSFRDVYRDIVPQVCQPKPAKMKIETPKKVESKPEPVEILTPFLQCRPEPLESFESEILSEGVRKSIKMMGLKQPTPIQKHSRRIIMSNSPCFDRIRHCRYCEDRLW